MSDVILSIIKLLGIVLFVLAHLFISIYLYTNYGTIITLIYQVIACFIYVLIEKKFTFMGKFFSEWNKNYWKRSEAFGFGNPNSKELRVLLDFCKIFFTILFLSPYIYFAVQGKEIPALLLYIFPVIAIGLGIFLMFIGRFFDRIK